jgi:hypothetical protein
MASCCDQGIESSGSIKCWLVTSVEGPDCVESLGSLLGSLVSQALSISSIVYGNETWEFNKGTEK